MSNLILLIAKGTYYVDTLLQYKPLLENRLNVVIYTDEVDRVLESYENADVRKYKSDVFRYFDKYKLTYQLVFEKKEPVMYIDVGRLQDILSTDLLNFDKDKINSIYTNGNWDNKSSAEYLRDFKTPYFELGYWDNILNYFENKGYNISSIEPILEITFVFPFNPNLTNIINEIESLRNIFENNSKTKKNVYSGIGNGEGLALGYALHKLSIKKYNLIELPVIKQKTL